jgi:hypothetical protein
MDVQTQYYLVLGLSGLAGLVWLGAILSAVGRWRAFRQRADLIWLVAFVALALATLGRAWAAWQGVALLPALASTAQAAMEDRLWYDLRFAALDLIAALLAIYAYVQKRPF